MHRDFNLPCGLSRYEYEYPVAEKSILEKTTTSYYEVDRVVSDESRNNHGKNLVKLETYHYTDYTIFYPDPRRCYVYDMKENIVKCDRIENQFYLWNFSKMEWNYYAYEIPPEKLDRVPKSRLKTKQLSKKVLAELLL